MASWYKDLLSNASTNISKLQRTYFGGESDGDTDDDTHVCRVLRAYYAEKGPQQPLPAWLPPDPRAPPPQQAVYAAGGGAGGAGQGRYGGLGQQGAAGGGGGLSSLWGDGGGGGGGGGGNNAAGQGRAQFASSRNPFASGGDAGQRPGMGGQRAGSYQTAGAGGLMRSAREPACPREGGSAQEKLKQRLWSGARTTSPSSGGPFQPPGTAAAKGPPPAQPSGNRWGWGNQGGSGGGGDSGGYGGRGSERPVMSTNALWSDGGYDNNSGGGSGGRGPAGGRSYGLPSNPRGGLPSGPRPR
ncbi:predicted protein [Chaetomium globosum CBS 148.51]|uniref:Mso1 N-terminal domain-containing protein n=1 Tax=Chaetomium globosum (strain ATCC 6205 / CBS 148.51 / DSM 1962 / NBRC 6347 / NRRL 1970) TaxID=306901 RepID=Q2GXV1_CHAGB|nr:uncharacterized protein CHGG_07203 [Chaetomium globosum CBS 148.51]EAQ85950.1 predicted protein [Chaetomium globosum CBS 148.51]